LQKALADIEIKPINIPKSNIDVERSNGITTIKVDELQFTLSCDCGGYTLCKSEQEIIDGEIANYYAALIPFNEVYKYVN